MTPVKKWPSGNCGEEEWPRQYEESDIIDDIDIQPWW